ncbi:MAG: hypothetical protein AAGC77_14270, partial [Pseudomonadota bacterium]
HSVRCLVALCTYGSVVSIVRFATRPWDCAADYWAAQAAGEQENHIYPDGWDDACWVITPEDSARKEQRPSDKTESATAHDHDINNKKAR